MKSLLLLLLLLMLMLEMTQRRPRVVSLHFAVLPSSIADSRLLARDAPIAYFRKRSHTKIRDSRIIASKACDVSFNEEHSSEYCSVLHY